MIIGVFGLYSQLFPFYELYIRPLRYIFVKTPPKRKNISKLIDKTDAEPMDTKGPKVTGKVKG